MLLKKVVSGTLRRSGLLGRTMDGTVHPSDEVFCGIPSVSLRVGLVNRSLDRARQKYFFSMIYLEVLFFCDLLELTHLLSKRVEFSSGGKCSSGCVGD